MWTKSDREQRVRGRELTVTELKGFIWSLVREEAKAERKVHKINRKKKERNKQEKRIEEKVAGERKEGLARKKEERWEKVALRKRKNKAKHHSNKHGIKKRHRTCNQGWNQKVDIHTDSNLY